MIEQLIQAAIAKLVLARVRRGFSNDHRVAGAVFHVFESQAAVSVKHAVLINARLANAIRQRIIVGSRS